MVRLDLSILQLSPSLEYQRLGRNKEAWNTLLAPCDVACFPKNPDSATVRIHAIALTHHRPCLYALQSHTDSTESLPWLDGSVVGVVQCLAFIFLFLLNDNDCRADPSGPMCEPIYPDLPLV